MGVEITVAKSFSGDCIWIRYGVDQYTNIIVDSGPAEFKKGFRELIREIEALGERVDLLVLTHIDDDHIKGFEGYLSREDDCFVIHEIMLNSGMFLRNNLHSVNSAMKLIEKLKQKKIKVLSPIYSGFEISIGKGKITLISPTKLAASAVENIIEQKTGKSLHSSFCDYKNLDDLIRNDVYTRDTSKTNKASIAFILSYENRKFAFLGDAHCEDALAGFKTHFNGCKLDLIKLSHHGSNFNINKELLREMSSNAFVITTDTPINKNTLARIVDVCETSNIYCNYSWWEKDNITKRYYFTKDDQEKYLHNGRINLIELEDRGIKVLDKEGDVVCTLRAR